MHIINKNRDTYQSTFYKIHWLLMSIPILKYRDYFFVLFNGISLIKFYISI